MLWKRLEAVQKFWRMISKSIQLISIRSAVNRELQGIHIGGAMEWIGINEQDKKLSMVLHLHQHNIGYTADGFYRYEEDKPILCKTLVYHNKQ